MIVKEKGGIMQQKVIFVKLIILIAIIFSANKIKAESAYVQGLKNDVDSLFKNIEEIHPNIYANISEQKLAEELIRIKNEINDSTNIIDFYLLVNPLVVKLGDGHTGLHFPANYLKMSCSFHEEAILFFPFSVKINPQDSVVTITKDLTNKNVPIGAEIIKINGVKAKDLVKIMLKQISGEQDFYKIALLKYKFTPLLYAIYKDRDFKVKYSFENKIKEETFKGLTFSERLKKIKSAKKTKKRAPYSLKIDTLNSIATIDFRQFNYFNNFAKFLDSTFTEIKNLEIKNLIIDIRNNGGGNSRLGDELFQYISQVPFNQFGKTLVKISKQSQNIYSSYADEDLGIKSYTSNKLIKLRDNPLRFTGNTYLLQSHYTFSSAASFSWAFKYFKMGVIIGEETGGLGTCFGDLILGKLPNSGLSYNVSHKKFYQYGATDEDTHGTIPDYEVPAKEALDFVIKMISNKNK